jgi:hypothetical protein
MTASRSCPPCRAAPPSVGPGGLVHRRMLMKGHRDTQSRGFAWLLGSLVISALAPSTPATKRGFRDLNGDSYQVVGKYASDEAYDGDPVEVFWSDDGRRLHCYRARPAGLLGFRRDAGGRCPRDRRRHRSLDRRRPRQRRPDPRTHNEGPPSGVTAGKMSIMSPEPRRTPDAVKVQHAPFVAGNQAQQVADTFKGWPSRNSNNSPHHLRRSLTSLQ